jgi:hypothetical protein
MIIHRGNQLTVKPDVYDVLLGEFDAAEAPLYNRFKKLGDSPDAALFNWPFDVADNPSNAGAPEGRRYDQGNTTTKGARADMYGRMHYHKEEFGVGEVSEGNQVRGTNGLAEYAYQTKGALRSTIKSAEYTLVGGQESQAGSKTVNYVTRGLERLIVDTAGIAVQTDTPTVIPAAFRPAAAQVKTLTVTSGDYPLTEANITDPFESIYNVLKSKINLDVFCTTKFKGKVSGFGKLTPTVTDMTVVSRFNNNAADMKVVAVIETYVGDCGIARFDLHPWLRHDTGTQLSEAIGLDMRYGGLRMRTPPSVKQLPDQAAGKEGYTQHMFGLQMTPKFQARWKRSA